MAGVRPSGHLQVKGEAGKRRYYALWRDADGRHQRLLGPAHVKDSRRRTPPEMAPVPAGRGETVTGEPMPNVVAAVRQLRAPH